MQFYEYNLPYGDNEVRRVFGKRLKQARKAAGLTQAKLAEKIGMTQGGYTQYENVGREPSFTTLVALARVLNVSVDWLLGLKG